MNPYWGVTMGQFFALFAKRFFGVLSGQLPIASDEVQIWTLILFGLSTVCVGVFLVLKKSTMQANALSHTTLLGIALVMIFSGALTFSLGQLVLAAIVTALLTALSTHFLTKVVGLQEDASIGLVFTVFFALGILLVTLYTRNLHVGVEAVMGNVDALHIDDLRMAFWIFVINLGVTLGLYAWYKMSAFDREFAMSQGVRVGWIEMVLLFQTTLTIMAGFRAVGVILVLALITGPVLIGRFMTRRLHSLFGVAASVIVICSILAVACSRHILSVTKVAVSTSGINILFLVLFFTFFGIVSFQWKRRLPS